MKHLLLTFFLFAGFIFSSSVSAINTESHPATKDILSFGSQVTVYDFLSVDIKNYRTAEGKKLKWTQRLAFKLVQDNLAKKVKKGKIDGNQTMHEAGRDGGSNTYGLLSLIFAVVGLFVPILGFALIVAALVLGIIGIRRDYNPTMAIIGLVLSALTIFLLLIIIAVGVAFLWV